MKLASVEMRRGMVISLALAVLAGCGSVQARRQATNPDALAAGKAILLLSTSAEESCFFSWQVDVYPTGTFTPVAALAINHSSLKSDFPDRVGFFDAFVLFPGDYDLRVVSSVGEINPDLAGGKYHGPTIRLRPGEMKYAGHVHVGGCHSLSPVIGDEWQALLPQFKARFPQLDMDRVILP